MGFLSRQKLDPPAVAAVRAASVDMAPSLGLTKIQEDAILNQGLAGRVQAVIATDTPLTLLKLLAHDPNKYVIRAFIASDFISSHGPLRAFTFPDFDSCFPPGLMPELWPSLNRRQREGVLAARATHLRGRKYRHVAYALEGELNHNPFVDHVPPIAGKYQVTAQDWEIYDQLRSSLSPIDDNDHNYYSRPKPEVFLDALHSSDPEVRLAAANHCWCAYPVLDILAQDATPIVADAAISQLAAADLSEYYVKSGSNRPLFNMDLVTDNGFGQLHLKTLEEIDSSAISTPEPSEDATSVELNL